MSKLATIAVCALLGVVGSAQAAGNPDAGKAKATTVCAACHGPTGVSSVPTYPNLCAQKAQYLVSSMKAYKEGQRTGSMAALMTPMAKPLTDQEIEDLSAYYAKQSCK